MKTTQIDILDTIEKNGVYTVKYWDEGHEGENNVTMEISEDSFLNHIVSNELNHEAFTNYSLQNLECDGLDERTVDPSDYLSENRDEVIKSYIQSNS